MELLSAVRRRARGGGGLDRLDMARYQVDVENLNVLCVLKMFNNDFN